jgi:hypothetical protein
MCSQFFGDFLPAFRLVYLMNAFLFLSFQYVSFCTQVLSLESEFFLQKFSSIVSSFCQVLSSRIYT